MAEHILVLRVACADDDELRVLVTDTLHCIAYEIKTLLVGKARYDSHHILAAVNRQTELLLKLCLVVSFLLLEVARVVLRKDTAVLVRVKNVVVDSVEDTAQRCRTRTEKSVKLFTEERILNLLGICFAYGGYVVSVNESALEHICVFVELKLVGGEHIVGQSGIVLEVLDIPHTLELEIMDSHDSSC